MFMNENQKYYDENKSSGIQLCVHTCINSFTLTKKIILYNVVTWYVRILENCNMTDSIIGESIIRLVSAFWSKVTGKYFIYTIQCITTER